VRFLRSIPVLIFISAFVGVFASAFNRPAAKVTVDSGEIAAYGYGAFLFAVPVMVILLIARRWVVGGDFS
jgi:ABC-type maltose transport system permease subunit